MIDHLRAALSDRYRIERELGRGGMASVWLARDLRHERDVAIKVLHAELAGSIGIDRFVREIRVTAGLQHPGIVAVLDSGSFPGPNAIVLPWYAMVYIDGASLRARLEQDRQLPIEESIRIAENVAAALATAHRSGVVHRDIKPENILLAGGQVYVADFGIARALIETGGEKLTSTGVVIGTPAYMSPEQATGDVIDARTDQYALACVLYEMLTGEPPFTGPTAQAVMARRIAEPARSIRTVRSAVSGSVEAAVLRGLERIPVDRFPDITAFASALRGGEVTVPSRTVQRPRARWPAFAAVALVLALLGGWLLMRKRAPDPESVALVQRGRAEYAKRTAAGTTAAIGEFSAAIARDSNNSDAWAGLAETYARAYLRRLVVPGTSTDSVLRLAVMTSDRALSADQHNPNAWIAKALVAQQLDPTDTRPVLRAVERALALDSSRAQAWHVRAVADAESGNLQRAIGEWRQSVRTDSSYVEAVAFLATGFYFAGQYDSAARWVDSAVALDPTYLLARVTQGQVAVMRGDWPRARAAYETARRISTGLETANALVGRSQTEAAAGHLPDARHYMQQAESLAAEFHPVALHTAVYFAGAYLAMGDTAHAFRWLQAYSQREDLHFQLHLRCDPVLAKLRSDARFVAMVDNTISEGKCR
ncbi:MAG TPA: protein kinase [Gemmatimonadales bacterium]|nr:protein kinase [Gemmatimonadales bacterium]